MTESQVNVTSMTKEDFAKLPMLEDGFEGYLWKHGHHPNRSNA